jgi:hypothetical protein
MLGAGGAPAAAARHAVARLPASEGLQHAAALAAAWRAAPAADAVTAPPAAAGASTSFGAPAAAPPVSAAHAAASLGVGLVVGAIGALLRRPDAADAAEEVLELTESMLQELGPGALLDVERPLPAATSCGIRALADTLARSAAAGSCERLRPRAFACLLRLAAARSSNGLAQRCAALCLAADADATGAASGGSSCPLTLAGEAWCALRAFAAAAAAAQLAPPSDATQRWAEAALRDACAHEEDGAAPLSGVRAATLLLAAACCLSRTRGGASNAAAIRQHVTDTLLPLARALRADIPASADDTHPSVASLVHVLQTLGAALTVLRRLPGAAPPFLPAAPARELLQLLSPASAGSGAALPPDVAAAADAALVSGAATLLAQPSEQALALPQLLAAAADSAAGWAVVRLLAGARTSELRTLARSPQGADALLGALRAACAHARAGPVLEGSVRWRVEAGDAALSACGRIALARGAAGARAGTPACVVALSDARNGNRFLLPHDGSMGGWRVRVPRAASCAGITFGIMHVADEQGGGGARNVTPPRMWLFAADGGELRGAAPGSDDATWHRPAASGAAAFSAGDVLVFRFSRGALRLELNGAHAGSMADIPMGDGGRFAPVALLPHAGGAVEVMHGTDRTAEVHKHPAVALAQAAGAAAAAALACGDEEHKHAATDAAFAARLAAALLQPAGADATHTDSGSPIAVECAHVAIAITSEMAAAATRLGASPAACAIARVVCDTLLPALHGAAALGCVGGALLGGSGEAAEAAALAAGELTAQLAAAAAAARAQPWLAAWLQLPGVPADAAPPSESALRAWCDAHAAEDGALLAPLRASPRWLMSAAPPGSAARAAQRAVGAAFATLYARSGAALDVACVADAVFETRTKLMACKQNARRAAQPDLDEEAESYSAQADAAGEAASAAAAARVAHAVALAAWLLDAAQPLPAPASAAAALRRIVAAAAADAPASAWSVAGVLAAMSAVHAAASAAQHAAEATVAAPPGRWPDAVAPALLAGFAGAFTRDAVSVLAPLHASLLQASATQLCASGTRGVGFVAAGCIVVTLLQAGDEAALAAFDALAPLLPALVCAGTSDGVMPLLAAALALALEGDCDARRLAASAVALDAIRSVAAAAPSHHATTSDVAWLGVPGCAVPIMRAMHTHAAGDAARLPACMKTPAWLAALAALLTPTAAPEVALLAPQLLCLLSDGNAELYAPQLIAALRGASPVRDLFSGAAGDSEASAQLLAAWHAQRQASAPRNAWSASSSHPRDGAGLLRVVQRGAAVRPVHREGGPRNGVMRARRGFTSGAHYWTVELTAHAVQPQARGAHAVGVLVGSLGVAISTSPTHLLGSADSGWALVTHDVAGRSRWAAMSRRESRARTARSPARCATRVLSASIARDSFALQCLPSLRVCQRGRRRRRAARHRRARPRQHRVALSERRVRGHVPLQRAPRRHLLSRH